MAASRIKIAKDKADLVKALVASNEKTAPFETYVEVLVFAAALGVKHKKRISLGETAKREPSPIPQEHFISMGYDLIIKLLAVNETKTLNVLSSNDSEDVYTEIFEEYANGGLEILQSELRGAVDYLERILLLLSYENTNQGKQMEEFNLSKFLN